MKQIYEAPVAEIEIVDIEVILNSNSDGTGKDPNQGEWDPQF